MGKWKEVFETVIECKFKVFGKWHLNSGVECFMYLPSKLDQIDSSKILGANPIYFKDIGKLVISKKFKHGPMEVENEIDLILESVGCLDGVSATIEGDNLTISVASS